jgi:hypothetical protein
MKTELNKTTGGANMARRSFLRYAGTGAATVAVLGAASCQKKIIQKAQVMTLV